MSVFLNTQCPGVTGSFKPRETHDATADKTNSIAGQVFKTLAVFAGATAIVCAYFNVLSFSATLVGVTILFLSTLLIDVKAPASRAVSPQHITLIRNLARDNGFVAFYDKRDPKTDFLGNFHLCNFAFGRYTFRCAEAAFQAGKDPSRAAEFVNLDGDGAFRLGKTIKPTADWINGGRNIAHMKNVLHSKFQNPQLRELLLATEDAYLLEHCPRGRDKFWADNGDGSGQNMLGKLLMELRGNHNVKNLPADAYTKLANSPLR